MDRFISNGGIMEKNTRIDALSWNSSKDAGMTQSFLGIIRFYQSFIGGIIKMGMRISSIMHLIKTWDMMCSMQKE
jgi:hypothetical protein